MTQRRSPRQHAKSTETDADLPFEEAFTQLQQIIDQLESGDLALDAAVSAFERGMRLAQQCSTLLDKAELRVQALDPQSDGSFRLRDIVLDAES
jgi:exodeoxyribonuclease VII small subunit